MWETHVFKKKIFYVDKLYVDVHCSFLLTDGSSQFKFLYVITPQFFLHVHKIVAYFSFF